MYRYPCFCRRWFKIIQVLNYPSSSIRPASPVNDTQIGDSWTPALPVNWSLESPWKKLGFGRKPSLLTCLDNQAEMCSECHHLKMVCWSVLLPNFFALMMMARCWRDHSFCSHVRSSCVLVNSVFVSILDKEAASTVIMWSDQESQKQMNRDPRRLGSPHITVKPHGFPTSHPTSRIILM